MRKTPLTTDQWRRVEQLFHAALQTPHRERTAFVDQACGDDVQLRAQVNRILAGHDLSDDFIEPPSAALAATVVRPNGRTLPAGRRIGRFELVRVIASGGMGTVYEAIQQQPKRTVALKMLRAGSASPSALRRFHHESQMLARLKHPGIAQVFEAGTYDDGDGPVPYFAMEHIPGARFITEHAIARDLGIKQRLDLFAKVCDAVHHGHRNGIIHRDLKPANILVDPSGQPKVIDFGVARATNSDVAATTMRTDVGQLIGTLAYMSPEQCAADPYNVDTRSDVYSLGVVLYELLCGKLPYKVRNRSIPDAARTIQDMPPARPSTVLLALRGDAETILLEALRKDRERRYQSAADLAGDLRRYLQSQPIHARPAGLYYQVRLFTHRHRAGVVAGVCGVLALIASVIVSTTFAVRATHAAAGEAMARDGAERITAFLQDMVSAASPYRKGRNVTVLEMLDAAANRIDGEFVGQPQADADVRLMVANTYAGVWLWGDVVTHAHRALELNEQLHGREHPVVADCLTVLGRALTFLNDPTAIVVQQRGLAMRRKLFGAQHALVADSMVSLAYALWSSGGMPQWEEAERNYQLGIEMFQQLNPEDHCSLARYTYSYASLCSARKRFEESEQLFREAVALYRTARSAGGVEDAYMVHVFDSFAYLLSRRGKTTEAAEILRESIAMTPDGFPRNRLFDARWRLATVHHNQADDAAAVGLYRESLAFRCGWLTRAYPEESAHLLRLSRRLAGSVASDGADRAGLFDEVFRTFRRLRTDDDVTLMRGMHDLGDALQYVDPESGIPLLRDGLHFMRAVRAPGFWMTAETESVLGGCLTAAGRYEEAEPLLLESFVFIRRAETKRNVRLRAALDRIAALYKAWGKEDRARAYRDFALVEDPQWKPAYIPQRVLQLW